jgi:hypothetical protein
MSENILRRPRRWMPLAFILVLSCNLELASSAVSAGPSAAPAETAAATIRTAEAPEPATATPEMPGQETSPQSTPTYTAVHVQKPPEFSGNTRYITDIDSRDYAPQKKAPSGWDIFANNRYERPYTAETMEYLSDVDLTRVELKIAAPWAYVTFTFSAPRAEGIGRTAYGAEFDTDKDGRGEVLVWGVSPSGAEWTTDGVEVREDSNSDVGGATPQAADPPNPNADGYDRMIFAGGQGADPDLAWIRQGAGGSKVQLAFKYSAIHSAAEFLWNGLADAGVKRSDWFDYNDHFTQAEAGSPLPNQADLYPLRALFGVDNTCRDAYGFPPTGDEPGLCIYYGKISGTVFYDGMTNGQIDPGESGVPDMTVTLASGACPSTPGKTALTDAEGKYSFPDLPQGPYCVRFINTPLWNLNSTPNPASVYLPPGGDMVVNFGTGYTGP